MDQELYKAALEAREKAYVPYSRFKVGAAVRTKDGRIFTGCNIENSSYGLTVCAERNAIFAAVGSGYRELEELCVVADTEDGVAPCGACRQVMCEFGLARVWLTNCRGKSLMMTIEELLPMSFGPKDLNV